MWNSSQTALKQVRATSLREGERLLATQNVQGEGIAICDQYDRLNSTTKKGNRFHAKLKQQSLGGGTVPVSIISLLQHQVEV